MTKRAKHLKTADALTQVQFPRRNWMKVTVLIPPDMEWRLYRRLRKRFEKPHAT